LQRPAEAARAATWAGYARPGGWGRKPGGTWKRCGFWASCRRAMNRRELPAGQPAGTEERVPRFRAAVRRAGAARQGA